MSISHSRGSSQCSLQLENDEVTTFFFPVNTKRVIRCLSCETPRISSYRAPDHSSDFLTPLSQLRFKSQPLRGLSNSRLGSLVDLTEQPVSRDRYTESSSKDFPRDYSWVLTNGDTNRDRGHTPIRRYNSSKRERTPYINMKYATYHLPPLQSFDRENTGKTVACVGDRTPLCVRKQT
ncbi:unnamed protein product [Phytomonas sp. Hart1]|nr:unnamed protein product [Phytomonas sp. Hart1]|eukprot:CCW71165.1 unnamed protein product [Phytomonas sp. isolate Hart1]